VPRNDARYAFKFATATIVSQVRKRPEESSGKRIAIIEACAVCLENTEADHTFSVV
jgi:hypothetical protein